MKRVFVDTSGFFAIFVENDAHHGAALELFQRAERERWRLVTSWFVIFETHALLLRRARTPRKTALEILDRIVSDQYQIVRTRQQDMEKAVAIIRSHQDKE